jgi:signal transduction histidine kinase/DNA-binding response OmpR family regulator
MDVSYEQILLVDSDPEISDLIARQTLKPLGYRVEVVEDVSTAIQEADRISPQVIIVNLDLPGLSGKDLLVALSSQGVDVPIIVVAGSGMEGDVIQAFRLGATDYLRTPLREAEIVSAVERALKQVRARRERQRLSLQLEQTNQELQQRVRELTTIFALGKAVTSITDQRELFDKIVEGAVYVSEAGRGWLVLCKDDAKTFVLSAYHNLPKTYSRYINQSWDDGLSSIVAVSGEALSIQGAPLKRFKISRFGKSALVVPVKVKSEVVGLLVVTRETEDPFSKSNQAMLEAVADYASISLVNVQLFKALENRAHSLQKSVEATKESEQVKAEILHRVSQELQDPLLSLTEHVDRLMSGNFENLTQAQRDSIEFIDTTLGDTIKIVEAITTLQEASTAQDRLTVNLVDIVRQTIPRYEDLAQEKGVYLHAELARKSVVVHVDPNKATQIIDVLLSNAIEFTNQDGRVTVTVERGRDKLAHVMVKDTGLGIREEHLSHIFDPFYQIDASPDRNKEGLGIGLALAKEIVRTHGGEIWVDSQFGSGSTFHFTLPMIVQDGG